jgi:protein TonB
MSKIDLISNDWVDLVFEGKNQAYGAYKLRKSTSKRNLIAIVTVLVAAVLAFAAIAIKNIVDANARVASTQVTEISAINTTKKKAVVKKQVIQKEPEKVVERVKSSVKFTAPVIKKDNEVKPEDELKTQDQLKDTKAAIGTFDVKGNDDANGEVLKAKEAIAQPEPPKHEEENKVFEFVEQQPLFPGGNGALKDFLHNNVKYPVVAQENGVQGRVVVAFVVEKDGSISDVHVLKSVDPSLDREATRVVKSMPRWQPGKQNGSAVRVKFNVPVSFKLQ